MSRLRSETTKVKYVGTQGSKMNGKSDLPVTEQGEELCFYQSYRNEPVPPDPSIISAVKHTPAVLPARTHNLPKLIETGKPIAPIERKSFVAGNFDRKVSEVPSFNILSLDPAPLEIERPRLSLEVERNANVAGKCREVSSVPSFEVLSLGPTPVERPKISLEVESNAVGKTGEASNSSNREEFVKTHEEVDKVDQNHNKLRKPKSVGSASSGGWRKLLNSCEIPPEKPPHRIREEDVGNGAVDNIRKGPKIFVQPDTSVYLMDVKISSAFSAEDFMIQNVDVEKEDELEFLQQDMYTWFNSDEGKTYLSNHSNMAPQKRGYYALLVPEEKTCVRVQLLHIFDKSEDVYVFCIDYGAEVRTSRKYLAPLKPAWKNLAQLSCHAAIENRSGSGAEFKNFKREYEYKTVTVRLERVTPKEKVFNNVRTLVKCSWLWLYNEKDELVSFRNQHKF